MAPFNNKASLFITGRKARFKSIELIENRSSEWIWFHVASLGEFEQAHPVMEMTKAEFPDIRILLTFFSPSGYEIRKDSKVADHICYLPMDTPANARNFVPNFNLRLACFVKYEYWLNYLTTLKNERVPIINFSAQFRPDQLFFKPWGSFYRSFLFYFDCILVQSESSEKLLNQINYQTTLATGDTRFDRVLAITREANTVNYIEGFKENNHLIVYGSVWPEDLKIIFPILESLARQNIRLVIAPHEVDNSTISFIQKRFPNESTLFSKSLKDESADSHHKNHILIIDTIGHLASIYQYADLVYVGGAFRGTLHNILEPAAYGIPLLFGKDKRNKKFQEASDLVNLGAAIEVSSADELNNEIEQLMTNVNKRKSKGQKAVGYITSNIGATEKTMEVIRKYLKRNA